MAIYILRGLPGSGKSTWIKNYEAENYQESGKVCSADHFHMVNGIYQYNPLKAGEAHLKCLEKYLSALQTGQYPIFVDNTNTQSFEIAPYWQLACVFGIQVKIIRLHVDFETACRRNAHKVPPARIWWMYQNLLTERLPSHWVE